MLEVQCALPARGVFVKAYLGELIAVSSISLGIVGCADIVRRAIFQPLPFVENVHVYGMANRTRSRAEALAQEFGIPHIFESLDECIGCPEIDAVYIALSNELHAEWTVRALKAGKHVLVEKPLAISTRELQFIEQAVRDTSNSYIALEGIMVQHHPWQQELVGMLRGGKYGKLLRMKTELFIPMKQMADNNYRCDPERGGGVFNDLGCYWLQFVQLVQGLEPDRIVRYDGASLYTGPRGCDWTFDASLTYVDGVVAELTASFEQPYRSRHVLETEQAVLTVNDFFRANVGRYKITIKVEDRDGGLLETNVFAPQHYYENQLRYFCDVITGQKNGVPLQTAYERIQWLELIRSSAIQKRGHST
jgi:dTDP-3,4-didehydro-2,6-dideoxy-alpha-D-glucose 3-reductase